jgi:ribosomal protein S18 acetylase RimI-like enzyme
MNIEIIPATAGDAEALIAIQQKAFKRLYDIYRDEGSPYLRGTDEIEKWLSWPNSYVYKIFADGELVGGVAFWERRGQGLPGEYYLARIYILPEMQGKGIASTAIRLCEAMVYNANRWSLDFPIDQIANRRCYEKAGYTDMGETREQSEGKIVLALYEKRIPPFRDIKSQLDNPVVRKIMAYSAFDPTPESMDKKTEEFRRHESWQLSGWVENGEIVGVCGFEVHSGYVEILNIAVDESARGKGIGSGMVTALWKKYEMAIEAETDDDAVDFYRKMGFETTALQKYNVRRWMCVKPAPKPLNNETDEERRARIYPIILSKYNPAWPQWYAEERDNLSRLLGDRIVRIRHIGSTAVPGLMAKPTVDILLEVPIKTNGDSTINS